LSGRLVVSVWRLVKTFRIVVRRFACAWCHRELCVCSVHPSLRIRVGAELHLLLNDVSYVAVFF
jgi:hypothetical protein